MNTCNAAPISQMFLVSPFLPVDLRSDLHLYYGYQELVMILINVRKTTHADSLALFAFNIDILLDNLISHQARIIKYLDFDLTGDVINDLQIKYHTLYGKFTNRTIEWRLNFGNQLSSLGDHGGRRYAPCQKKLWLTRTQWDAG